MAHSQVTHNGPQTEESNGARYNWAGLRVTAHPQYQVVRLNSHHLESPLPGPSMPHTLGELAKSS